MALTQAQRMALDVLDRECFPGDARYPKHTAGSRWWIVDDAGSAVAFAGVRIMPSEGCAFLARCGVLPEYRGQGLQRRLIAARLRYARRFRLPAITYTKPSSVESANNLITCGFRLYSPARLWAGRVLYWWKDTT
jgi:GNAT superfamily N-acetyltransferase